MSQIKTNKISPRKGTTTTITDSGDTVTVSSGANINNAGNLTISNLTNSGTITSTGTLTTAGISGSGTINNTTGTITGLQGAISWQTGSIKTANFTASANEGYFLNTTSGQITVTLPASPSAGDVVAVKDYADTFDTNKAILNPNGNKIQGSTGTFQITVEGTAAILLYVDSTKGWLLVDQSKTADITGDFITATGGTITTCGDFKIHKFTGPGTFCVSAGSGASVDYLVVAGGGGGGSRAGGGGGAGGFRMASSLPVSVQGYPIAVGGGGAGGTVPGGNRGTSGATSSFSTIASAGGGGAGGCSLTGLDGGSGGGGGSSPGATSLGGSGNTPPVSPPQGNDGGRGGAPGGVKFGGGGGGAAAAGTNGATSSGGTGGNGSPATPIFGDAPKPFYPTPNGFFSGGGGGTAGYNNPGIAGASGGSGGGGDGADGGDNEGGSGTKC